PDTGELLVHVETPAYLLPCLDGASVAARLTDVVIETDRAEIRYDAAGLAFLAVTLELADDGRALDLRCRFVSNHDVQLNALELFSAGTVLNLHEVVNFRNRHHTPRTWPELLLGNAISTTTYSDDWQFAPHPTALLFTKNRHSLFAGFTGLQASFGMQLKALRNRVERWTVDFGPHPHGLVLKAGEEFRSAPLRLFVREQRTVHQMYAEFGRMLVDEGEIPDPAAKHRHAWWLEPLYCTWNDQRMLADHQAETELLNQTAATVRKAVEQLDESLVRQAAAVIRRERLPVKTILLDEGWSIARGDWRPDPSRFPNLRGLVDELHSQGFKVMVWWNWAEIAGDADIPRSQLAADGWTNRHGHRWRDYSDPRIQEDYFKPLMRTLFSSDPGCYDLDGVKTDFLADKVHPDTPLHNPSWRGEERYFTRVTELFHREMRRHKPDALHLGCAGNYWLADLIDLNRTYDVHTSNWLEHEERARMLQCTAPGVPVSYDMHEFNEGLDEYFDSARRLGVSVELGNVLVSRDCKFAPPRSADAALWTRLRKGCSA
ncbi:MAG TPA: TIM-barrel domain-containing protein, partial [Rariglobus sp.]